MSRTKVYEDKNGNASSARLIGLFVIGNAVLMLWACILFGFWHPDSFSAAVGTGVGLFTAVTTATFVYLYSNKKKELENLPDEKTNPDPGN